LEFRHQPALRRQAKAELETSRSARHPDAWRLPFRVVRR